MATKKLSEALAELQKAASVSGLDVRLVVAGQSSTDNAQTITLQQLLTALNVPTVQTGVVGNNQQYVYSVSSDNTHAVMSGTFKAFQNNGQCLIRHKFWGSTNDYTDGQYTTCEIPKVSTGANGVFEAAMLVRLRNTTLTEVNSTTDKVVISYPNYADGSTKSLEISKATTAKAGVMTAEQVSALNQATTDIASLKSNVPTEQTDWHGYEGKYIYSHQSDPNRQVLSGNFKVINVGNGVEIQHRIWGATEYTDEVTKKAKIPIVNPSQYGVMNKDVFKRMLYHTHYESGSTTNAVNINYTNYETGGTSTLTLTAASSAKAGVMTSSQYNQLADLSNHQRGSLGTFTTTDAFKTALANMPTTHKGKYGRYYALVNGAIVFVSFALLEESSSTYSQWVEGSLIKSGIDGDIYLNNELGVHIIGRVYSNGAWGLWRSTVLDDEVNSSGSSTTTKQYLKWDSANHKYSYVTTEIESNTVIPIASATVDGLLSKENAKSLSDIQSNYKDFGHFDSESAALAKLVDLSVCADSNIVHAHMTYANGDGKNTLILIQSIDGKECRQIIYNKMKIFHRAITFTDTNRTAISFLDDFEFLLGDRLQWSKSDRKYILSQFGNGFNHNYTEPIPLADTSTDGLMSKSQVTDLASLKTKVENIKDEIPVATDSSNGLMSMAQVSDLVSLKKNAKKKKTTVFPPCVHKAIPLRPKKGRRYYNREGRFYFNIKKEEIDNGYKFQYIDNLVGAIQHIKVIHGNTYEYIEVNLQDYFSINKNNWVDLFGYGVTKIQFCVNTEENGFSNCIEILSDEAIVFSDDFKFSKTNNDNFRETASPLFVIENGKVKYTPSQSRSIGQTHNNNTFIGFYYKNNNYAKSYKGGELFEQNKRWRRVKRDYLGVRKIPYINKRSYKFRLYKARKKWNRLFMSNVYIDVLRFRKGEDIYKILP